MAEGMIEGMPNMYKLSDWQIYQGDCSCCGNHDGLRPMMRPENRPLSDDLLIKMAEEFGEQYAEDYHLSSRKYVRTRECNGCRSLSDDGYFTIIDVRQDR